MTLRTPIRLASIFSTSARLLLLFSLLTAWASVSAQAVSPQPDRPGNKQEKEKQDQDTGILTEDWTKLSVSGLDWQPLPPMPGGTVERPEFTREYVRLQWRQNDAVDVFVVLPRGVRKPHVVLYLYGYPNDLSRFASDEWSKGATEKGFAAVGFVSALTGERARGNRPMKEWFVSELQESLGTTTHDVQMILNYLAQRGDLNTERVGMYAQGSGASIAILAASVDSRIAALDLLNPWGDWPDWLKQSPVVPENQRAAYLRPEFLEKVAMLDPVKILPKLTTPSIRLQQVVDDPNVPPAAKERIAAALPHGAQVLQSENWTTYRKAWQEKKLWSWIKDQLEPAPASASEQRAEPVADGGRP
jgi:hypothetical protein